MDENRWIPEKHQLLGIHQKYHLPKGPRVTSGTSFLLGGKKYRNSPILHPVSNKKSLGFRIERTPRVASTTGNHLPCDPVQAGLAFDLLIESQDLSEGNGHDFGELYTPQKLTCSNGQNAPIFPIGNTSSDD